MERNMNFEAGKTYTGRSICDSNCIYRMTVVSRTPKTIKVKMQDSANVKTLRPGIYDGVEFVKPNGSYSMALIIRADKVAA